MKICIAGKNEIATNCADWLLTKNLVTKNDLLVCINKSDKGIDTFQRSFRRFAEKKNLVKVCLEDLYKIQNLIFFSLEFDRIIKPSYFSSSKLFNVHFSLLPKYKGMYTSAWPLLNGEKRSGVTLHLIDHGIDTGDIIDQLEFDIEHNDNCRDLYFKYTLYGIELFQKNYSNIIKDKYLSKKQSAHESSYYSRSSINYLKIEIDLNKTAHEINNQIRAFSFKEYQLPFIHCNRIISSKILDSRTNKRPGSILIDTDTYIDIATIDYDLRLIKAKI